MKRQGDLLFLGTELPFTIEAITTNKEHYNAPFKRANQVILLGEATGHAHKLEKGDIVDYQNKIYLVLNEDTEVTHEEHAPIQLEKGFYLVKRQREYVSADEERTVYD